MPYSLNGRARVGYTLKAGLGRLLSATAGLVSETDAAGSWARLKRTAIGTVAQAETVGSWSMLKRRAIGQAEETDAPGRVLPEGAYFAAEEADSAGAWLHTKRRSFNAAEEIDTPGSLTYVVHPIAFWASDTATSTYTFPASQGYTVPYDSNAFLAQMDENILRIRQYFWDRCDGFTFTAAPAQLVVSASTTAEIVAMPNDNGLTVMYQAIDEIRSATGVDGDSSANLLAIALPITTQGIGSDGRCYARQDTDPSQLDIEGTTCVEPVGPCVVQGAGDGAIHKLGTYFGAHRPDGLGAGGGDESSVTIMAHELGHAFGYDPTAETIYLHITDNGNLMQAFITYVQLENHHLRTVEVDRFKASPFLTYHPVRPS